MRILLKDRRIAVVSVIVIAFGLRLSAKVVFVGEGRFWIDTYREYYNISYNLNNGKGFCASLNNNALLHAGIDQSILGRGCAHLPPGYPVILSLVTTMDHDYVDCFQFNHRCRSDYWRIILAQALMSTGTVICTFFLGSHLFGRSTGLLASLFAAVYPYYVWHDTSFQETGVFTFFTILSVLFLYKASRLRRKILWISTGVACGATVLTRANLAPFVGLAALWLYRQNFSSTLRERLRSVLIFAVAFVIVLIPWLVRNSLVLGAPVITTQTGRFMWIGNNANTFSHYPATYIDLSEAEAWQSFTVSELEIIRSLSTDEISQSRWFFNRGLGFIVQNPRLTVLRALRKVWTGFSWNFSPVKERLEQWVYFISYFPILVLGVTGMWLTRLRWRELGLIYLLFLTFVVSTAVFWAHTSHRTYLDVYLMVFAAHVCRVVCRKRQLWFGQILS